MQRLGDLVWAERRAGLGPRPGRRRPGRSHRSVAACNGRSPRSADDTGSLEATWFGRRYIESRLKVGSEVVV